MQRVVSGGKQSSWTQVISGVPQGTIIGQILFLLCVNDLPDQARAMAKMFADDTKLYESLCTVT